MKSDIYNQWPDLKRAITAHRQARLAFNFERTPVTFSNLTRARRLELRLRYKYRANIHIKREEIKLAKLHTQRYHWQLAQRGRTTTERDALIQSRRQARRQAREYAERKREDNLACAKRASISRNGDLD